jgi:hypothetical protein
MQVFLPPSVCHFVLYSDGYLQLWETPTHYTTAESISLLMCHLFPQYLLFNLSMFVLPLFPRTFTDKNWLIINNKERLRLNWILKVHILLGRDFGLVLPPYLSLQESLPSWGRILSFANENPWALKLWWAPKSHGRLSYNPTSWAPFWVSDSMGLGCDRRIAYSGEVSRMLGWSQIFAMITLNYQSKVKFNLCI